MICERLGATIYRKVYELKKSTTICIILFLFPFSLSIGSKVIFYFNEFYKFSCYTIALWIDLVTLIIGTRLYFVNKKYKRLALELCLMLSEKFQIGENIQILSMIIPMIYQLGIFNILFLGFQYTSFIDEKYKGDLMLCSNTMTLMIYGYYALNFCLKQGSLCDWRFNNSRVTRTPVVLFSNMSGRRGESTTRIYSRFLPKRSVLTVPLPVDIIEEARKRETSIDTLNYINNFESL